MPAFNPLFVCRLLLGGASAAVTRGAQASLRHSTLWLPKAGPSSRQPGTAAAFACHPEMSKVSATAQPPLLSAFLPVLNPLCLQRMSPFSTHRAHPVCNLMAGTRRQAHAEQREGRGHATQQSRLAAACLRPTAQRRHRVRHLPGQLLQAELCCLQHHAGPAGRQVRGDTEGRQAETQLQEERARRAPRRMNLAGLAGTTTDTCTRGEGRWAL